MVMRNCSWSENRGPKLYLTSALRKEKKLALISGKELKSLVMSGREEVKIISMSLLRN